MARFAWWILLGTMLLPAVASASADDAGKQVVVVQGGATVPPPTVVVTPVPAPEPVYVQAAPAPEPVYVQAAPAPQLVYVQAAPQPVAEVPAPPEEDRHIFVLTANPLFFWFGALNAKIALGDLLALSGQFDYMYVNLLGWKMWLAGVVVGLDIFVGGRSPQGFFFGPRVGYDHFDWTDSGGGVEVIRAGAAAGYQWIFSSGFALSLGGSLMYIADVHQQDTSFDSWVLGIPIPSFDLGLGFGV